MQQWYIRRRDEVRKPQRNQPNQLLILLKVFLSMKEQSFFITDIGFGIKEPRRNGQKVA